MSALILMVGIPGSGKTTLRNKITSKFLLISPDDYIGYTKENPWTPTAAMMAWKKADDVLTSALKDDNDLIIFDATFVSKKRRRKYIEMATKYNYDVVAIYCCVRKETALIRNASREQARSVPNATIENMYKNLVPPVKDEGFKCVLTFDSETNKLSGTLPSYLHMEV